MSMNVDLRVHEIAAQVRGDDPDRSVIVGQDGLRVVVILDPDKAGTLAKVLARFDAQHTDDDLDFEFDRSVWLHAMVDLLASQTSATCRPVPVYAAPAGVAR